MKENPFHIIPKILAAAAGFLAVVMVFAFAFEAFAFVGPSQAPTNGSGAIGSDASNNVSVGTPTTIPGTKLVVIGASSDNTTNAAQFLENNNTPIFILRDDGSISIATTTVTAGTTIIGGNLTIGGTVTAPNLSSFIGANLVTSGEFGDGNGNYTFGGTSNVYFPGSGIWNSSGNVGIGMTGPAVPLDITGSSVGALRIIPGAASNWNEGVRINSANNGYATLELGGTGTSGTSIASWGIHSNPQNNLYIDNDGNVDLEILQSSGNVGIGTTNPTSKLQVAGNTWIIGTASIGQNTNGTAVIDAYSGDAYYGNNSATNGIAINSSGNVGIGTTNPGYALDVNGHANALGYCINGSNCITSWPSGGTSQWATNGSNIYYNSGNVGIGTTAPAYPLDVNGMARATALIDTGVVSQPCIGTSASGQLQAGTCGTTGALTGSGTTNVMAMFTNAGVVGNSSPVITESGTSGGTVSIAGNVGIGTTNPGAKLDVTGGINLEANGSNDAPLQVGYTSASPAGYYATYAP